MARGAYLTVNLVSTSNGSVVERLKYTRVRPGVLGWVKTFVRHVGAGSVQEGESAVQVVVPCHRTGSDGGGGDGRRSRSHERLRGVGASLCRSISDLRG